MKLAKWLVVAASVGHLVGYSLAVPEHVAADDWPPHARFHVLQSLIWVIALNIVTVLVALGPFARGRKWARWALLVSLLGAHGGYFIALATIGGGPPEGLRAHVPLAIAGAIFAVGLALGWRQDARRAQPAQSLSSSGS